MSNGKFSPFIVRQQPGHCGPCSLSACLFMLGIDATQRDLAWAAGKPYRVFVDGLDEDELNMAARKYGVRSKHVLVRDWASGRRFAAKLRKHLGTGNPAILLVEDTEHWIAVVGMLDDRFVIYDPIEDEPFYQWGERRLLEECLNESSDDEPDQYFAILLRRGNDAPPVWHITRPWMNIHNRGSDVTAGTIACDLEELVAEAAHHHTHLPPLGKGGHDTLAQVLERYRKPVLGSILNWGEGSGDHDRNDLKNLYDDYIACAGASYIAFPSGTDHATLVSGLTGLFGAYWWGAEMDAND